MHQGGTFPDQEEDDDEEDLVMSSRHRIDDPLFRFGQYRDNSYRDVTEHNAGYFFWAQEFEEALPLSRTSSTGLRCTTLSTRPTCP